MATPSRLQRFRGALLGLAACDALGTTLEFSDRDTEPPIDDIVGGGPFGLAPGEWTDDTSMALCLAESLIETGGFDPRDQMQRYVRWWRNGHLSSNGTCFDIGTTVASALRRFEQTGNPLAGSDDPDTAGNGSLMRLAPVPLFASRDIGRAISLAGDSSKTTHGAREAVDACRYMAALIVAALDETPKANLLSPELIVGIPGFGAQPLSRAISDIAEGRYHRRQRDEIRASGYVVHTLEAALWAFASTDTFLDGALLAVNLGEDADTTGAVYGQLAGAYYGADAIPERWHELLAHRDQIQQMADRLYELAEREPVE